MKTPGKPREKSRAKGEGNAASEPESLMRFRKAAKAVISVDREEVKRAEEEERKAKKPK